jgi:tRNA threonylcarbamoyladenosine biosynthesis protein TsaE
MAHFISRNEEETLKFAKEMAKTIIPGQVIYLKGDLGSGKTTFTRGFCRALGYTDFVHSPSYSLIHHYENVPDIFHLDLYRVDEKAGVEDLGLDYYPINGGITLIEWPQGGIQDLLPPNIIISFENLSEDERLIEITEA